MTLGELLENILLDIDEDKYDTDMTNKITKFINRGYRELAKREGLSKRCIFAYRFKNSDSGNNKKF